MRIPAPILVVLMMAFVALAGCFGADDEVVAGDGIQDAPDEPKVSATMGSLRGTVASDLFEPLAGARVTVVGTGQEATVARNGAYVLNDVDPGRHTVEFAMAGYAEAVRPVTVEAGMVARLDVQLVPLPSSDPYTREFAYSGMVESLAWQIEPPGVGCIVAPNGIAKTCSGTGTGENTQVVVNVTEDVQTILVEMAWDPAGPLGEHLSLDFMCEDAPRGNGGSILDTEHPCYYAAPGSQTPLIIRVDRQDSIDGAYKWTGDWDARVFASHGILGTYDLTGVDVGIAYEQKFTMYVTVFYRAPAPEGFSGIPDQ